MNAVKILIVGIVSVVFVIALDKSIDKSEIAECLKWQEQSGEIVGFHLTSAERAQCEFHNIKIK